MKKRQSNMCQVGYGVSVLATMELVKTQVYSEQPLWYVTLAQLARTVRRAQLAHTGRRLKASVPYHKVRL